MFDSVTNLIFKIAFGFLSFIFSIVVKVLFTLRLGIPLAYFLVAQLVFSKWWYGNQTLAEGILYALLGLILISWIWTAVSKIQQWRLRRKLLKQRIEVARETEASVG